MAQKRIFLYSKQIDQSQENFLKLLETDNRLLLNANDVSEKEIFQIVSIIHRSLNCNSMNHLKNEYLKEFSCSKLLKENIYQLIDNEMRKDCEFIGLIESLLSICLYMVKVIPNTTRDLSALKDRLNLRVKNCQKKLVDEFKTFSKLFKQSEAIVKTVNANRPFGYTQIEFNDNPPDKFEQLNIIPTLNDIFTKKKPYLHENITNGAYKDVYTYLDINFRLLHEDFMISLRERVQAFRSQVRGNSFNFVLSINII